MFVICVLGSFFSFFFFFSLFSAKRYSPVFRMTHEFKKEHWHNRLVFYVCRMQNGWAVA
jgi:hypothetical protein